MTRPVATADMVYVVADAELVVADALIVVRLLGAPDGTRARTARAHARVHVTAGHLVVTGRADLVLPRLATADDAVVVTVRPPGRPARDVGLDVPMTSALPLFPPDIEIDGVPGHLAGTVTRAAFPYAAVAGVVVRVSLPPAAPPPSPPPFGLGLRTTVARDHAAGAVVRERTLTGTAAATTVTAPAIAGVTRVVLASVAGCGPGGVLALGAGADLEHLMVEAVDAAASAVTVSAPLRRTRGPGQPAEAFTLAGTGAGTTLRRPARPGDGLLLTAADLAAAALVEIVGPNPTDSEVRAVNVVTNTRGHFRLDGVRGVDRITLTPQDPPNPPAPAVVILLDPAADTVRCDLSV